MAKDTEAANILVGRVDFLKKPIIAFARLLQSEKLTELTEVRTCMRSRIRKTPTETKDFTYSGATIKHKGFFSFCGLAGATADKIHFPGAEPEGLRAAGELLRGDRTLHGAAAHGQGLRASR